MWKNWKIIKLKNTEHAKNSYFWVCGGRVLQTHELIFKTEMKIITVAHATLLF